MSMDNRTHLLAFVLAGAIRIYAAVLRPIAMVFGRCRFYPSCSDYAAESIRRHGVVIGVIRALQRLGRCHPMSEGGVDLP